MSPINSKFNNDQIETLINFVKTHKVLYASSRDIGTRDKREKLWEELSRDLHKSRKFEMKPVKGIIFGISITVFYFIRSTLADACKKKFKDLRDRFVRKLKKGESDNRFRAHFKKMMFLLEIHPEFQAKKEQVPPIVQLYPISSTVLIIFRCIDVDEDDASICTDDTSMDDYATHNSDINFVDMPSSAVSFESNNLNGISSTDRLDRPISPTDPIMSPYSQSSDVLDKFLLGLGATIRTFPEIEIARLKLELSTVVFNKELELTANRIKNKNCNSGSCKCNCNSAD